MFLQCCKWLTRWQWVCRLMVLALATSPELLGLLSKCFLSWHPKCLWLLWSTEFICTMISSWDQSKLGCGICWYPFFFVKVWICYVCFYKWKGAYISRYQMPKEFLKGVWLACHTKGIILADARCPKVLNNFEVEFFIYKGDGAYTGDNTKSFGSMSQKMDDEVRDGGYVRGGVGGGLTFICKDGVNGSSLFIPSLFILNPVPQYSRFHQTIPSSPSSILLFLCAICNSLFNCLTFPAWISAAHLILLILLLSTCFFFIHILSAISSGSRSWMSYRHVSRCMMWTFVSSSNVLGSVKKLFELKMFSPSSGLVRWGIWHFLECVFIAGGVITISTIGSNPGVWWYLISC